MELISQRAKRIMEGCKKRASDAGLRFDDETLEYIVSNRDLLELSPKMMIPTLYDYWVHDVQVLKEKGKYELYPSNPYETVINTRPAISFYNDNNPDWLNVMIFYHVLGHIDFFQNNIYFKNTWDTDFTGRALSDKRIIARLRSEKGRWVDYVIEFSRGIDNLVGYFRALEDNGPMPPSGMSKRLNYYFDVFLQQIQKVKTTRYIKEIQRYNQCLEQDGPMGEQVFFSQVTALHPEFEALFDKYKKEKKKQPPDLMRFIMDHSIRLNAEENQWMKTVMSIVRNTSLFFQPQIRTKIMNEGWASHWHEKLFLQDERIRGHEVDFARVNAHVTALPRLGLNPYALGMRLFSHIFRKADKGRLGFAYDRLSGRLERKAFDQKTGQGEDTIFHVRENECDFTFINRFLDQEFVDKYRLFVAGRRLNRAKMVWEAFVKSRRADEYRKMLMDSLYHPPFVEVNKEKTKDGGLYLVHRFEGKPLVTEYIANTLMGVEFLWGATVFLETHEVKTMKPAGEIRLDPSTGLPVADADESEITWQRVLYTMYNKKLTRREI